MKIICLVLTILLMSVFDKGFCACFDGLPSPDDLERLALDNENQLVHRFRQLRLFPSLNFSCQGIIASWKLAAPSVSNGGARPELSIWRLTGSNQYSKVAGQYLDANLAEDISTNSTEIHIHTGTLDPPLLFQPGDVLGLLLRQESRVRFTPYLLPSASSVPLSYFISRSGSPENDVFNINQNNADNFLPVLSLEMCTCSSETSNSGNDNCGGLSLQSYLTCPVSSIPATTNSPATTSSQGTTISPATTSSQGTTSSPVPSSIPASAVPVDGNGLLPTPTSSMSVPVSSAVPPPSNKPQTDESSAATLTKTLLIVSIIVPCGVVILALVFILVIVVAYFRCKKGSKGQWTLDEDPAYSIASNPVDVKAALEARATYEREMALTQSPTYETIRPWPVPKDFPPPYTPHDDTTPAYATVGERL